MLCQRCGSPVEKGWRFCPNCGNPLSRSMFDDVFEDIFERINREMKEMDKLFDKRFEALDLSPFFSEKPKIKRSGFSIRIVRKGDSKPEISVKTFGDVDRKEISRELEKLGVGERRFQKREAPGLPLSHRQPKVTEEPKTDIKRTASGVVVEMKLPGVKDERDIEIKELESSVEVKAMVGDKAYFKILTKPQDTSITEKSFKNGVLRMVLS